MKASARWLNTYLASGSGPLVPEQIEHALTHAGFPIESIEPTRFGNEADHLLDVEVTSNRGDCLSHVGLARELAAAGAGGRTLALPAMGEPEASGTSVDSFLRLRSEAGDDCPHFLARVVRGVKVGPSPAWLRDALVAVGQRSINNIVDATNFVLLELGNPSHAFDLATLHAQGGVADLVVRRARAGERLTLLDGTSRTLVESDVVVADEQGALSLAGVMGGESSSISEHTIDVVLEVATWRPTRVRATARRLNIRTDASHRFERVVDARTLDAAMNRLAALVVEVAGGALCPGVLRAGAPVPAPQHVVLRLDRCRARIGLNLTEHEVAAALKAQGFGVVPTSGGFDVAAPAHRPDVRIEEDLIEEVARTVGYARIPLLDTLPVRLREPQKSERAAQAIHRVLAGLGFYEAVTFAFTTAKQAKPFVPGGLDTCSVSDERRGSDNILRPSPLTGLLSCRRANQDARVTAGGGVRLYELSAAFAEERPGVKGAPAASIEQRRLALLADLPTRDPESGTALKAFEQRQLGVRLVRGVVDALADELAGAGALSIEPAAPPHAGFEPGATARVLLAGKPAGWMGLIDPAVQRQWGLEGPVAFAEIDLAALIAGYPPRRLARALPTMPATERDLSLIVSENAPWASVQRVVAGAQPQWLEELRFVGVYRGKPIEAGKKSVTLRMVFRDAGRTLRDDEVNAQVERVVVAMTKEVGAVVRTV